MDKRTTIYFVVMFGNMKRSHSDFGLNQYVLHMDATLSFWNRSMSQRFTVNKTFNDVQHYENYVAKMKSLGYTEDETWSKDEVLIAHLREGFDKAIANSNIKVVILENRLFQ